MWRKPVFVLFIFIPFITFSQVDLNKGLVAYYPFNGNANDVSGNGNNPIFNNATLTSDYYGKPNSAYHFNGVDNYMEIANKASLNPSEFSLCAMVNVHGFYYGPCYNNCIIDKGDADGSAGDYSLRFTQSAITGGNCDVQDTINQQFVGYAYNNPVAGLYNPKVEKNVWSCLVYTLSADSLKLYVDGNLVWKDKKASDVGSNAYNLFLGRKGDTNYPYWLNGDLDEVRIYNRAINAEEVKAYSVACVTSADPCNDWLKTAGVDPGVQIGKLNVTGNKITVEALVNRTETYRQDYYGGDIVSKHTDPTDVNYLLRANRCEITTSTGWYSTPDVCPVQINKTYHVAMVYDGSTLKFYRNGFLLSETQCTGDLVQNDWITRIGSTANPDDHNPSDFHGYINEVRIWNVARTQDEIRANMNQPLPNPQGQDGLLAYYTFNDLKNKQGNSQWDGSLLNDATINQTNPECNFVADSCKQCTLKVNAGPNVSICYKDSVHFKATGAVYYNWNASAALSDTTIANPVAKPLKTTEFIVTGYDSAKTCSDKDTVIVSVLPLPVFSLTNDTTICKGTTVQLNANGNGNYYYHWLPQNYLSDTTIANPTSNPADSINYYVIATDSNECRSIDSVQIDVVPKPTVSTINDTSICAGSSITLSTNAKDANRFSWNPSTGLNNNIIQSPQAAPTSTINYIITASNTLCSAKDSVKLTILALPNVSAGNDTTICTAGVAHLHASGAINYVWYPDINLSDTSIANPLANPSATTIYYLKGTDNNNCINTDSIVIVKQENPIFSVNPLDSSICSGHAVTLKASGGNFYKWSPSNALSDSTIPVTIAKPSTSTKYSVYIYDSTCRTSGILNSMIDVVPSPQIILTKSNDIDCSNLTAQLNASGGASYSWSPASYIDNSNVSNPLVNPPSDTKYTVTVTGADKCSAQASVLVKSTLGNVGFNVANAFTPNGDGLNDCFGLSYWGTPAAFDMQIYDKWGVPVYHSQNINECWDGTYKGKKQASGTYVYMITATSVCGHDKVFRKGTVVLIR